MPLSVSNQLMADLHRGHERLHSLPTDRTWHVPWDLVLTAPTCKEDDKCLTSFCAWAGAWCSILLLCHWGELQEPLFPRLSPSEYYRSHPERSICHCLCQVPGWSVWLPNNHRDVEGHFKCFTSRWSFHHACGALDGKHVAIKCLKKSSSMYYNYTSFYSTVLLGLVSADYKFIWVHVGASRTALDATLFSQSSHRWSTEDNLIGFSDLKHYQTMTMMWGASLRWCIPAAPVVDDALHASLHEPEVESSSTGCPTPAELWRLCLEFYRTASDVSQRPCGKNPRPCSVSSKPLCVFIIWWECTIQVSRTAKLIMRVLITLWLQVHGGTILCQLR